MNRRFPKLALATTATTYLLIVVGALVRASGAGMGCPEWPTCYGRWVPPTDVSQVAPDKAATFNAVLTWTEYLNRLLGVTTGLLVLATFAAALVAHRKHARVFWPSFGALVGVSVAGWLGKKVVDHKLEPSFVTVHMFVALATIWCLLYATVNTSAPPRALPEDLPPARQRLAQSSLLAASVLLLQVGLGTSVRATLERVASLHPDLARGEWIHHIGGIDPLHRTLALAVAGLSAWVASIVFRRADPHPTLRRLGVFTCVLVLAQIGAGVGLAYGALPPALQIAHLALATLLLGALVLLHLLSTRLPATHADAGEPSASEPGRAAPRAT